MKGKTKKNASNRICQNEDLHEPVKFLRFHTVNAIPSIHGSYGSLYTMKKNHDNIIRFSLFVTFL